MGGLPDVVPEGTLLNMVLKRMHRPRSCSYQLLLEHQRPSCIQGLRWVSAHHLPGPGPCTKDRRGTWTGRNPAAGGVGASAGVDSGSRSLAAVCVGGSHNCTMCACVYVVLASSHSGVGEGERDLSFICHLCVP